ncbi:MAG: hypothetical protein WCL16_11615 [bacterium]
MNRSTIKWISFAAAVLGINLPAPGQAPVSHGPITNVPSIGAGPVYALNQFGPVGTPQQASETFTNASAQLIAAGGGMLIIPPEAPKGWTPKNNTQGIWLNPPAPAPSNKGWGKGPGVTVIDYRTGTLKIMPPQVTGLEINRVLDLPQGQSLPHWDYQPMIKLNNAVLNGSNSYRDWLQEDVKAGKAQRFYVRTIRGLFPGAFMNSGDYSTVQRLYVQSLGYDKAKQMWYFLADTDADIKKGALIHNKNHVNVLRMDTWSHNENQTFDFMLWRHNYSQGDNYLFDARFSYMGDVHSTAGDENGVIYAAFVQSEINAFRGKVESWNPATAELKYKAATKADTLGSGRPLINLNPAKWITNGVVRIVRPASWTASPLDRAPDPVFQGKTYPTTVESNNLGIASLKIGGLIRLSADAPAGPEVAGRYFAVDQPGEYVGGKKAVGQIRRWYLIDSLNVNPDGTRDLRIVRHWWGAKSAGAPTLYRNDNYTSDGHDQPLRYVIAPGVNVYDVSDGVESPQVNKLGSKKILRLAPAPFAGTAVDFATGDAIEQAIGPDPFKPIPFRSWLWDAVPGAFPAPVFDVVNHGVMRHAVLTVAGGSGSLEKDLASQPDASPPWDNLMVFNSACNNGIVFAGDTAESAIFFAQPNGRAQPIKWLYGADRKEAALTVSPVSGTMKFDGNGISVPGGLTGVGGISATPTMATNLRGIAIPVKAGEKELAVNFANRESDDNYAIFVQLSWLSRQAVVGQTPTGFTVRFETPPARDEKLHWLLVR